VCKTLFHRLTDCSTGCQADVANNILVDSNGDEYQCTDTNLTPDDVNQLSTCPLDKDQMYSGDWSVVIISNNGNGDPIAYERDFYLTVGLPVTSTFTPTVTLSSTLTPIVNTTTTVADVMTAVVNATVTDAAHTKHPTTTVTPQKVVVQTTQTLATIYEVAYTVVPVVNVHTYTASCHVPKRQQHPDPKCTITPTLVSAAALSTSSANKKHKKVRGGSRRIIDREVSLDREQRIAERKARLGAGLEKRSPDNATVTVTDTNTNDFVTTTFVSTAPATTIVVTSMLFPLYDPKQRLTVSSRHEHHHHCHQHIHHLLRKDHTAPRHRHRTNANLRKSSTILNTNHSNTVQTHTKYAIATDFFRTQTLKETVNIWTTYINPSASAICKAKGGQML